MGAQEEFPDTIFFALALLVVRGDTTFILWKAREMGFMQFLECPSARHSKRTLGRGTAQSSVAPQSLRDPGGGVRRRLATLTLSLALVSVRVLAQDEAQTTGDEPTIDQLQEMKHTLELQRQKIEKLKQEAQQAEEELRQMQRQIQEKRNRAAAPAVQPGKPDLPPPSLAKSMPPPENPQDPNAVLPRWAVLKISDTMSFRFGVQVQAALELLQDPNTNGYSQNLYLRRARVGILGDLGGGVTMLFQTAAVRLGYAGNTGAKNTNSGFQVLDAWAQWAFLGKAARLQAGLFRVPTVRQAMTFSATFLTLDLPTWTFQEGAVEESTLLRDYGVGFNGALLANEHLSYRIGIFSGYRHPSSPQPLPLGPAAGSRNPPRIAGRIMYDFFEPEGGTPNYIGTYLGKRKVLAIGLVGDGQGAYKGYGGDVFFDWPIGPGAVTAELDYIHFDGHHFLYDIGGTPTTLPEQQTFYTNEGYYFACLNLQPFFRYETLTYADPVNAAREQTRVGGGFNYYVYGRNLKATAAYERIMPRVKPATAVIRDFNRFVLQLQGFF